MTPLRKQFARFTNYRGDTTPAYEIPDEAAAVKHALHTGAMFFTMHDVESVVINDRELKSDPFNQSGKRYTGIHKISSVEDVLADVALREKESLKTSRDPAVTKEAFRMLRSAFNKRAADAVYIIGHGRPGEYTVLGANEKAFDHAGRQIWPKP